jgi:hypothetical protein
MFEMKVWYSPAHNRLMTGALFCYDGIDKLGLWFNCAAFGRVYLVGDL